MSRSANPRRKKRFRRSTFGRMRTRRSSKTSVPTLLPGRSSYVPSSPGACEMAIRLPTPRRLLSSLSVSVSRVGRCSRSRIVRIVRRSEARQGERLQVLLVPVELVFEEGHDVVFPDLSEELLRESLTHEVTRTDLEVAPEPGPDLRVQAIDDARDVRHLRCVVLEPSGEQPFQWLLVREQGDEVEPPSQGGVDQADRPVRRVHRSEDQQVRGERESDVVLVHEDDLVIPVLEQIQQFPEDLG